MELWIRSQDKIKLINAKYIDIIDETIYGYTTNDYNVPLGEYRTEERALKVLDEIQNIIRGKFVTNLDYIAAFSKNTNAEEIQKMLEQMAVYDMPKE